MSRYFILFGLTLFLAISCDKNDCPYQDERLCDQTYRDSIGSIIDDTLTSDPGDTGIIAGNRVQYAGTAVFEAHQKNALLEYYTGYRCSNCPPASATANNLKNLLGERLVLAFMHTTSTFAAPIASPPAPFSTDFRTVEGEQFISAFQIFGLPNGTVNRKNFGTGYVVAAGDWSSRVDDVLSVAPGAFLVIRKAEIQDGGATAKIQIALRALNPLSGSYNLTVGIMEDGLIEAQKDGPNDVYPYTHNHVFRGNINGLYGELVLDGNEELTETEAYLYAYTIDLHDSWTAENCKVFAYLHDSDTREVIQSTEKQLAP